MLSARFVEDHADAVRKNLATRRNPFDLDPVIALLTRRRARLAELEGLQARRNSGSKEVGALMKSGQRELAELRKGELAAIGVRVAELERAAAELQAEVDGWLLQIPNLLADDVPIGASSDDNVEVRRWGELPEFPFEPKDHADLGIALGIVDFDRAAAITGARFAVLKGQGARLSRSLASFMLDLHTESHGYQEVLPPFIVQARSLVGTGQLPKFEEDLFRLQRPDDWYLIPTAEVPVTNLHRDEIMDGATLPVRYASCTPCFRAEAGTYGRDTRGLIRQHQFEKVEVVQFTRPEDSEKAHEELVGHSEAVLQALGLTYRVVVLCSGDTGFGARKCYDIEVWLPGQQAWREISSCSNYGDFQARRANIRFRRTAGAKPEFVHTLNGSALPLGRTWVAILEQFQEADGRVRIPSVLRPSFGGISHIG